MGNFVDKDVAIKRSLSIDPPNSAGAVYQFLSSHPKKQGVKIEGAYRAPVLKVRKQAPRELDSESRKAWSFYLYNMQERLAGAEHADTARQEIELLFRADRLKLSVGKVLGVLRPLMEAEQAQLAGANSYVKRWLAHEKAVLQLAVPHDPGNEYLTEEARQRGDFVTACKVLSRFTDCENGEIDTDKIRDEAYKIGYGLSREEVSSISFVQMKLNVLAATLGDYIGPEARMLLNLCIAAHGKTETEYRQDTDTKQTVSNIALALQARTPTNEYQMPTSPRTVAERAAPRRNSMPVFYVPETTATSATTSSTSPSPRPEKGGDETRKTPPPKSPPATPRRGSPESDQNGQSAPVPVTPGAKTYGRTAVPDLNMGAAMQELKSRQALENDAATASQSPLSVPPGPPPVTPRSQAFPPSSAAGSSTAADSSTTLLVSSKTPSSRKRMEKVDRSDPHSFRQKSDGSESLSHRARPPKSSRRVKSMVSAQPGSAEFTDAADQKALSDARDAARALKDDQIKPRFNTDFYNKWMAVEKQLDTALTPVTAAAVQRLILYCHEVRFEPGSERNSLDRVIKTVHPTIKERNAYIAVRDMLLAEARRAAATGTTSITDSFPELVSLLVFAVDAESAWRQGHKAKSSH